MVIDYNNPALKKTQSLVYLFYNYSFNQGNKGYGATVVVVLLIAFRVILAVLTANLAGYAFARLHFKGRELMFGLVLFQMMIPAQIFIIPQYVMVSKLHLTNTIFGLVFPSIVSAFGTFLMRQAYLGLPKELEEAARLDGCNIPQTFCYIMAPLTKSSMVALGIFTSVFAYKELM